MRPGFRALSSAILLFATVVHASPDHWQRVGPLVGDATLVVMHPANPDIIYATASNGLQRTLDGGETWSAVPVPQRDALFDPAHPDVIYAFTYATGISRSTDGGVNWSTIAPFYASSLAIDPNNSNHLYAGTVPTGVYVSTNAGATWTLTTFGAWGGTVGALAIDPANGSVAYAGTAGDFDNPGSGLFKTTDGGATWLHVATGPYDAEIGCIAIDPANSNVVYAGTTYGGWPVQGLLRSSDAGATWAPSSTGLPDYGAVEAIASDPRTPNTLYIAASEGLYRSVDAGAHWAQVDTDAFGRITDIDLPRSTPNTLCVASLFGVLTSSDNGEHFTQFGTQPTNVQAMAIDRTDSNVLYATGRGIFKSSDRGAHWQPTRVVGFGMAIAQDLTDPRTIYAGAYTDEELAKSTDAGATWSISLSVSINDLAIAPSNPRVIYAGGGGIFKTANGGASWVTLTTSYGQAYAIDIHPTDDNVVYVGGMDGLIRTVNGGATWTRIENGLNRPASGYVLEVIVDPVHPETVYCGTSKQGVFKSLDGGMSWSHLASPLTDVRAIAIDPTDTQIVYASVWDGAVFVTVDGGAHWQQLGTPTVGGSDLVLDPKDRNVLYSTAGPFLPNIGAWRYERMAQCAAPVISSFAPGAVDLSDCEGGCDVVFNITTPDDYASVAVVALQRKSGDNWIEEDRLLAPLSAPAWELRHTFGPADAPGEHVFRSVTRGADGSRAVSNEVVVSVSRGPVATLFASVNSSYARGRATVGWSTQGASAITGFNVYRRASSEEDFRRLNDGLIPSAAQLYVDESVVPGAQYSYRVGAVDQDGEWLSPTTSLLIPAVALELMQNRPNPFNPSTTISFCMPATAWARLSVYDVNGRFVATLVDRVVNAGDADVVWDGKNSAGVPVGSGVYFYRLSTAERVIAKRMLLLK